MHNPARKGLRLAVWANTAAGYMALASTSSYSPLILLIPALAIAYSLLGERLDERFSAYRKITRVATILYALFIPVSLIVMSLLNAVTSLVVFIHIFTLAHRKTAKNYYHLLLMSFFLLLAACVLSPEPVIALVLLLFLLSAVFSFMMLQFHDEFEKNRGRAIPDIVPLNVHGPAPLSPSARLIDAGLLTAIAIVSLVALIGTAGIFFLMPRMEMGILGRADNLTFQTGLDAAVDLTKGGQITRDRTPVMRVEFPEEPDGRFNGVMLWRVTTLDNYDGVSWRRRAYPSPFDGFRQIAYGRDAPAEEGFSRNAVARQGRPGAKLVHQMIYLDQMPDEGLPCLHLVQRVRGSDNSRYAKIIWDEKCDYTVEPMNRTIRRMQYEVWSDTWQPDPDELRKTRSDYDAIFGAADYDFFTRQDLEPRTIELVKRIARNADTPYDKTVAITQFFAQSGFMYSLNIPQLPASHPMDAFIHEFKRGHCELYASAMALMVRSLGIPARLVSGLRGGEWNPADKAYTVQADMAHLWVEVYFHDIGWVPFDPTPPDPAYSGFARSELARYISHYVLKAKMIWYRYVIGFNRGVQLDRFRSMIAGFKGIFTNFFNRDTDVPGREYYDAPQAVVAALLLLMLVLGVLTVIPALWQRAIRRSNRRFPLTPDQNRAVKLRAKVLHALKRHGVDTLNKTAEEILESIEPRDDHPVFAPARDALAHYNRARFGGAPLSREDYDRMAGTLR